MKASKDAIPEHISDYPMYDEGVPEWVEPEHRRKITNQ